MGPNPINGLCPYEKRKCLCALQSDFGVLWPHGMACGMGVSVPQPGIEPMLPVLESSLNRHNTRECPGMPKDCRPPPETGRGKESLPESQRERGPADTFSDCAGA